MRLFNIRTHTIEEDQPLFTKQVHDDLPLALSIPHGGEYLLDEVRDHFEITSSMPLDTDLYTQEVYAMKQGITVSSAIAPDLINFNRPKTPSHDTTLPVHLRGRDCLHKQSLTGKPSLIKEYEKEEQSRLFYLYDTYHRHLSDMLAHLKEQFGFALMVDCHSMNSVALQNTPDEGQTRCDFTVGTLMGSSVSSEVESIIKQHFDTFCEKEGYSVSYNFPYQGGFITRNHRNPQDDIHVFQIEVKRSLYMIEGTDPERPFEKKPEALRQLNDFLQRLLYAIADDVRLLYQGAHT